jgi:hypothetical protein
MAKVEVIKKVFKYPCYCCKKSIRGITVKRKNCKTCNGTGYFLDEMYYHIVNGICVDGDTYK